ncbi:MAG: hypothetical protein DI537_26590 [Stutzerimonas stutzeri]|nr:MAG: hypothetical protein DI537_26590 [Stutzerimonas stutzeri]
MTVPPRNHRGGTMTIFVERLEIAARIGVHAHERGRTQPLLVSVDVEIAAPEADEIGDMA